MFFVYMTLFIDWRREKTCLGEIADSNDWSVSEKANQNITLEAASNYGENQLH